MARSIVDMKCPKCKKTPSELHEVGTVSVSYDIEDKKIETHTLNPTDYYPIHVIAECKCGCMWKLKKVTCMSDIKEFEDYDECSDK